MTKGGAKHLVEVVSADRWVERSVKVLADAIHHSLAHRGECLFAVSGGSSPAPVFQALGQEPLEWAKVTIVQVDERISSRKADLNRTQQLAAFGDLPVEWLLLPNGFDQAERSAEIDQFESRLVELAGSPPQLDVVHLGLGADGHTASLVPGDPVLEVLDRWVAVGKPYMGHERTTLTRSVFDTARHVVWLIKGEDKVEALDQLMNGDQTIPAGLLTPRSSHVVASSETRHF